MCPIMLRPDYGFARIPPINGPIAMTGGTVPRSCVDHCLLGQDARLRSPLEWVR
jgi:hypothetical protein